MINRLIIAQSRYNLYRNINSSTTPHIVNLVRTESSKPLNSHILPPKVTTQWGVFTDEPTLPSYKPVKHHYHPKLTHDQHNTKLTRLKSMIEEDSTYLDQLELDKLLYTVSYIANPKTPTNHVPQISRIIISHIVTNPKRRNEIEPHQFTLLLDSLVRIQTKIGNLKDIISIDEIFDFIFNYKEPTILEKRTPQTLLVKLATHPDHHPCLPQFIDYVIRDRIRLYISNSIYLIRHLFNYSKIASVVKYHHYLKSQSVGSLKNKSYYEFIRGFSLLGKASFAESIIELMQSKNFKIPFFFYLTLIHGYGANNDFENLVRVYGLLINQRIFKSPDQLTNIVVSYCKNTDQIHTVLDKLSELSTATNNSIPIINSKIKLNLMNNDMNGAMKCLEEIKQHNFRPDHFTYIPFIDYYIQKDDFEKSWELFIQAKQYVQDGDQAKPIYDRMIRICCEHRKPDLAYSLIQDIVQNPKRLDASSFSPLMEYHFKNRRLGQVIDMYHDLFQQKMLPFNGYLFNIYLKSLCKLGDIELAYQEFMKALNNEKYFIEVEFIYLMSYGFGFNTNLNRIIKFFNDPELISKIQINSECYNSGLFGLLCSRQWDQVEEMMALKEFTHNQRTLELLCGLGARHQRHHDVIYWFDQLVNKNPSNPIVPTDLSVINLILSYYRIQDYPNVEKVFLKYFKKGLIELNKPVVNAYLTSILHIYGPDKAQTEFQTLQSQFSNLLKEFKFELPSNKN